MHLATYHQTKLALGGDTTLVTTCDREEVAQTCLKKLWQAVFLFEKRFSRFLPASELSAFNRNAGTKQPVSPEFKELLLVSLDLAQQTDGLYNPFILPALQKAGYKNSMVKGFENDKVDDHSRKTVVSIDALELADDWARIPYGTALDMGGCGKGYLADQLASMVNDKLTGFWFSLGGDLVAYGTDEKGQPHVVKIQNAFGEGYKGQITLSTEKLAGVATSGTTVRRGQQQGKNWHHIINPKTLQPADTDIVLATVCADSAVQADVLASCAVILGSQKAPDFLKSNNIPTYLLQITGSKGQPEYISSGNNLTVLD